ncbi:MAG: hypothetical protein Kow00129_11440 [Thermoleophilia bacterium]
MPTYKDTAGYSLIEAVVVVALVAICVALPLAAVQGAITQAGARASSGVWQAAVYAAQQRCMWRDGLASLEGDGEAMRLLAGAETNSLLATPGGVEVSSNVPLWSEGTGVRISFSGLFGAPSAGGSLFFAERLRLTIRPESGYVYRRLP